MKRLLLLALLGLASPALAGESVTPVDALTRVQAKQTTLIDVRTPEEWAQTGVAPEARRIVLQDPAFVDKVLAAVNGAKDKPVTLICRSGNRSAKAMALLEANGFTAVSHVETGMNGWTAAKLPVER